MNGRTLILDRPANDGKVGVFASVAVHSIAVNGYGSR